MDKIGIPDKINFHKVVKREEQIKREKAATKGWKVQVNKLEDGLVAQGSKVGDKKATKKLIYEKDKHFETLQKKLKFSMSYHPQTEETLCYTVKCHLCIRS